MPLVRIEQLHYRYPPFDPNEQEVHGPWALENVSLTLDPGQFLGVLGTTGSGKSTLCLALTGLVPQQTSGTIRGDVWIDDLNTKRRPVVEIATRVGIVFQDPEANFLGLTVEDEVAFGLENLAYERPDIEDRLNWTLALVGMSRHRFRPVSQLSGGQKQRVALASVLAMTPDVLVLDDPTAELDPVGTAEVLEVISAVRTRNPGMSVVMTSGDPSPIVDGADSILVLDQGHVIFSGSPNELLNAAATLLATGVTIPPLSELATIINQRCDTAFVFSSVGQAARELRRHLAE